MKTKSNNRTIFSPKNPFQKPRFGRNDESERLKRTWRREISATMKVPLMDGITLTSWYGKCPRMIVMFEPSKLLQDFDGINRAKFTSCFLPFFQMGLRCLESVVLSCYLMKPFSGITRSLKHPQILKKVAQIAAKCVCVLVLPIWTNMLVNLQIFPKCRV